MTDDIRIAIIGTGHIAHVMADAIRGVPGLTIAAICSRDEQRGGAMASAFGTSFLPLEQALASEAVDAVYIANETATHAATAIRALELGKAVLCEKPLAVNADEARAIGAAARQSHRLFMEAVATPFLPAVKTALDAAASGSLGDVRHLFASFGYPATAESHPGCYAPIGGGVLLDRGVYLVTLARLALGPIEHVEARIVRDANGIDTEASLLLTHAGGATSTLTASLTSLLDNSMTIGGTCGVATVEAPLLSAENVSIQTIGIPHRAAPASAVPSRLKKSALARRAVGLLRARSQHLSYGQSPYAHELAHFRDLYHAGAIESPILPLDLSIDVMRILDTARGAA